MISGENNPASSGPLSRPNPPEAAPTMPRRGFIQKAAGVAMAAGLGIGQTPSARARQAAGEPAANPAPAIPKAPANNLVGIQMGPHTLLDEGIEHALDLIQETAAINALFVYSHAYGGDLKKDPRILAQDHGIVPPDQRNRNLPLVWVRQHDEYFKDTTLRHPKVDASFDYHDHDLFKELVEPARKRGMKIFPRILEAGPRGIENYSKVTTVTANGNRTQTACWNHPEYKAFWNATAEDLFRSYDVDGFQWGAERASPLARLIQGGNENSATCFCEFCLARGKAQGIDPERARQGFTDALAYVRGLRAGNPKPADGAAAGFFRILLRHPEILAWEYQYRLSREEIMQGMYDTIKKIKPDAQIGWHVDHWATSMDFIGRSAMTYAELAPWSDYLKIVVYHAVAGPRIESWVGNEQRSILHDLTRDEALDLHYELFGYDKTLMPKPDHPASAATWPDYVFRETARSVGGAEGKTKIYPGIGFNLPGAPDDPETIYATVLKSYQAGAEGIVASREYEEMTVPNLKAVGRAVRALAKA
jgi:hypothetical protein